MRRDGWAIEARVYAEDAFGGFLPQAGTATYAAWPTAVRVDQALESGQTVSTSYDPMLGKIIATGADREAARTALVDALDETAILGLTTNTGFLRALVASEAFAEATIDTAWLDLHEVAAPVVDDARTVAAWVWSEAWLAAGGGPFAADGFRIAGSSAPLRVGLDRDVEVDPRGSRVDGRLLRVSRSTVGDVVRVEALIEGRRVVAHVRLLRPAGAEVVVAGQRHVLRPLDPTSGADTGREDGRAAAPMPGTVLELRVASGDEVSEGQVLGTIGAMKVELSLRAAHAGTVTLVGASVGEQVALSAVLFEAEAKAEAT